MGKVMSMLEKYNLFEKVSKEDPNDTSLKDEDTTLKVEADDCKEEPKEETKVPEQVIQVIKEKPPLKETNVEYEKKMTINEIYSLFELGNSNINTVFMLQNLINALPQNLPQDVIKQSVMNIISASNIDLKELISDGDQRLEVLDKVMAGYYNQTNKRITEYKQEIDKLSSLIKSYQEQIHIKEAMLEEQTYLVKYETQKIGGIIDFFQK